MTTMTKTIDSDVLEVLKQCTCEGKSLTLPRQLERKLYERTNKVLDLLGGKWNKKAQAHLFDEEPEQGLQLAIMTQSVVDFKKQFQIFETPDKVADMLVEQARIHPDHSILEPSAGRGAIIRAINRNFTTMFPGKTATVSFCEMHDKNAEYLTATFGQEPICRDFLQLEPDLFYFDRIVMNPPFRNGQDIQHVRKAYDHLKPGGRLVAIMYPGWEWRTEKKFVEFREWMASRNYDCDVIPAGSFSSSGTEIETLMVTIDK